MDLRFQKSRWVPNVPCGPRMLDGSFLIFPKLNRDTPFSAENHKWSRVWQYIHFVIKLVRFEAKRKIPSWIDHQIDDQIIKINNITGLEFNN